MENYIQLKKDNRVRIGIKDAEGNDTGNILEFDMEDIELPLKAQQSLEMHKSNIRYVKQQFDLIDKVKDKTGKKMLSANVEAKMKVIKEFYRREAESVDIVLGKGATEKLLNGRKPYYSMYDDFNEYLKPVLPILQHTTDNAIASIEKKYSENTKQGVING